LVKLFIWDIDGTLIRGNGSGRIAMNRAFERLYGIKDGFENMYLAGSMDVNTIYTVFAKNNIELDELDRYLAVYYEELQLVLCEGRSKLLPGVQEVLDKACASGTIYHAIGTGNVERGARIKLEQFHLNFYFPVGGFSDKPMERFEMIQSGIRKAQNYYGIDFKPECIVVIGDTVRDVEAGMLCNVATVSVATGGDSFETLQKVNPGRVLNDLSDYNRFFELI
jgi:phosphoglycolate phosphatase